MGQITAAIGLLGTILGAAIAVHAWCHKTVLKIIKEEIAPLKDSVEELQKDQAKDYIIHICSRLDAGESPTPSEVRCLWENYDVYRNKGGNGFIKSWVERLQDEGKLESNLERRKK